MTDKETIKKWFTTGSKPTQEQFWAWQDAYWHKSEKIPIERIEKLDEVLQNTADASQLKNLVRLDASNIDKKSREALRSKLGVGDLPKNLATTDDLDTISQGLKDKIDKTNRNKVDKTTATIPSPNERHKYVYIFNEKNEPVRMLAGDLGKNIANAKLTSVNGAGLVQSFSWLHDTQGYPYYLKNLQDGSNDDNFNKKVVINEDGSVKLADREEFVINIPDTLPNVVTPTQSTMTVVHQGVVTPQQLDTNILELNQFIMNLKNKDFTPLTADDWFVFNAGNNTGGVKNEGSGVLLKLTDNSIAKGGLIACAYPKLVLPADKNWAFVIGGGGLGSDGRYNKGFIGITESVATTNVGVIDGYLSSISTGVYINETQRIKDKTSYSTTFVKVGNILNITVRAGGDIKSANVDVTGVSGFKPLVSLIKTIWNQNLVRSDFGQYWIEE